jgi:hypothetical protein
MAKPKEPWVITEAWEGDGGAGAAFDLPNGLTVFVSDWRGERGTPNRMTEEILATATHVRDLVRENKGLKHFAGLALQGLLANPHSFAGLQGSPSEKVDGCAQAAVIYAQALLEALNRTS